MSPWTIVILVYLATGAAFGVFRIITEEETKKQLRNDQLSPAGKASFIVFVVIIGWWLLPILETTFSFRYRNRINIIGFESVVTKAISGHYSDDDLLALKSAIFQEQQKAIAAGNSPEEETVNRWINRIDGKIARQQARAKQAFLTIQEDFLERHGAGKDSYMLPQ